MLLIVEREPQCCVHILINDCCFASKIVICKEHLASVSFNGFLVPD